MNGHLVTVEVGVERGAAQGVQLERTALDQHGLERLNASLDQRGVGKLVEMSVKLGRSTRPELHVVVCGETGGDPKSVEFYHNVGLDYVSCSPFRVPVARLAAAQAAVKAKGVK